MPHPLLCYGDILQRKTNLCKKLSEVATLSTVISPNGVDLQPFQTLFDALLPLVGYVFVPITHSPVLASRNRIG